MSGAGFVPFGGFDGFLYQRTERAAQAAKHEQAERPSTAAALNTFRARVDGATTAASLAADPTLRAVALQAFGLGDAQASAAFVREALSADPADEATFLARFGDAAWLEMNRAFGFGGAAQPRVGEPGFADEIVARHRLIGLDARIGATDPNLRRALTFDRVTADLASVAFENPRDGWRRALADDEVRAVFRSAWRLDSRFETAGMEARIDMAVEASRRAGGDGTLTSLAAPEARDAPLRQFFSNAAGGSTFSAPPARREGLAGFLDIARARDSGQARFDKAVARGADAAYLRAALKRVEDAVGPLAPSAANAARAEAFADDERLVRFTLDAFGLTDRAPTAEFMRAILQSDPDDADSAARRQADPRWAEIARTFGFGADSGAATTRFGFVERLLDRAAVAQYEQAASAGDADMRIALLTDRTLEALADAGLSRDEGWRRAVANASVGFALTEALGLTEQLAGQPLDARITAIREAARAQWRVDDVADFANDLTREGVVRDFFASRREADREPPGGLSQPVIPIGGGAGWAFLERTFEDQKGSFLNSSAVRREMDYFRENIGAVRSADDLVADQRLLTVALQAFGLQDEASKTAFVRRVLEEGVENPTAAANRIPDARWREVARAFGFGDGQGAQTATPGFAEEILSRYGARSFEIAVGEVDQSMRLALNFQRTAESLAASGLSEQGVWFRLLGDPATRSFLETMYNLPREFAQIDVDQQVAFLSERTSRSFGASITDLGDAELRRRMIDRFFALDSLNAGSAFASSGQNALALLQAVGPIGGGSLLSSRV